MSNGPTCQKFANDPQFRAVQIHNMLRDSVRIWENANNSRHRDRINRIRKAWHLELTQLIMSGNIKMKRVV